MLDNIVQIRIKELEPLYYYSSKHITQVAKFLLTAVSEFDLINFMLEAKKDNLNLLILGGGTKYSPKSEVFEGLVIKNENRAMKMVSVKGSVKADSIGIDEATIQFGSGVSVKLMNKFLIDEGFAGFSDMNENSSVAGEFLYNKRFRTHCIELRVFDDGNIFQIDPLDYRKGMVILSLSVKIRVNV